MYLVGTSASTRETTNNTMKTIDDLNGSWVGQITEDHEFAFSNTVREHPTTNYRKIEKINRNLNRVKNTPDRILDQLEIFAKTCRLAGLE